MEHSELARLRQQLETLLEGDRRKSRFLDLVAHELRNPIAAISMAAEAMLRFSDESQDAKALTLIISRQSQQAGQLINDLLDYSRLTSGQVELQRSRFDLRELLSQAAREQVARAEDQSPRSDDQLPPGPLWVDGDRARIARAIAQGFHYLGKQCKPGERISLSAEKAGDRPAAIVELRPSGSAAATGEVVPRQSTLHRGDAAIDLALACAVIEAHGGTFAAINPTNEQTLIRLELPLSDQEQQSSETKSPDPGAPVSLSVLIIDDDADVATSLEFLLCAGGHTVTKACRGAEGLETAFRLRPDAVLCDINLPDLDGLAVARQLRADARTRSSYLIAVSGFSGEENERRSREAGFDMHLNKPEGFIGLSERLREVVGMGR